MHYLIKIIMHLEGKLWFYRDVAFWQLLLGLYGVKEKIKGPKEKGSIYFRIELIFWLLYGCWYKHFQFYSSFRRTESCSGLVSFSFCGSLVHSNYVNFFH